MTYYTCGPEWEDMLTCIYDAWSSKKGHANIKLMIEPVEQYTLFDEYIHVTADPVKAEKVADAVCRKISPYVYQELAYCACGYQPDILDTIYRVMILGFAYGPNVLEMVQYKDVMHFVELNKRVHNEAYRFLEILRFHEMRPNGANQSVYVAHIEPRSKVASAIAPHFEDRMPSENWMIVDDTNREAVVYQPGKGKVLLKLSEEELENLLLTEKANDSYTDLWKIFFDTIAIKERENKRCQMNHFPLWARKHAVEFM